MAYAMVSTVSPKASATPSRPMPTCGNAAESTALPQPPKTSQKVPKNSAETRLDRGITISSLGNPVRCATSWLGYRGMGTSMQVPFEH